MQQRGKGRGQGCKNVSATETILVSAQGEPVSGVQDVVRRIVSLSAGTTSAALMMPCTISNSIQPALPMVSPRNLG